MTTSPLKRLSSSRPIVTSGSQTQDHSPERISDFVLKRSKGWLWASHKLALEIMCNSIQAVIAYQICEMHWSMSRASDSMQVSVDTPVVANCSFVSAFSLCISMSLGLQVSAERLAALNPRLYNFQVGNFDYTDEELHLGQLQGRSCALSVPAATTPATQCRGWAWVEQPFIHSLLFDMHLSFLLLYQLTDEHWAC